MADGKFINTEIVNELDAIVDSFKQERLPNPFYNFNTSKGTTVTYYNVDMQNYPLDTVTGMQYASVGPLTNAKYNKIEKFVLYGLEKVLVTLADTDDGTEGEEISGDAIVLPNTIHPYAGDFFTIDHAKEKVLFRVIDAQSDTFENGANVYQINYKLEHNSNELIEKFNVGTESTFLLNNVGTNYTLQVELKVRTGAGTNYRAKRHSELTSGGRTHDNDNDGALNKGTVVTCQQVAKIGNDVWIKCPSGWLAAYYQGHRYVS